MPCSGINRSLHARARRRLFLCRRQPRFRAIFRRSCSVLLHQYIAALRFLRWKVMSLRQTPNLVSIEVVPRAQPAARRPAIFEWSAFSNYEK